MMNIDNIINHARIYKAEIDKLSKAYSDKYSLLEIAFLFPKWYRCLNNKSSPVQDQLPWITFSAIKFLKKILSKEMIVYEFGSGGSTLFFANNVKQVYSVEHDPTWFLTVSNAVKNRGYTNWSGRVVEPVYENGYPGKSPSDPDAYISGSPEFRGYCFKYYVESIDDFSDEYFDLVLIDGRARPSCFKHAIPKVKVDGYIVWDNTDRSYYLDIIDKLQENLFRIEFPGPCPYIDYFTQTSVWVKHE